MTKNKYMKTTTIDMNKANGKNVFADAVWREATPEEVSEASNVINKYIKLEPRHLVGYLPYELNVIDEEIGEKFQVAGINISNNVIVNQDNIDGSIEEYGINLLKPTLHPFSYLTKEIEHNGEKFIPLVKYVESLGEPCDDFDENNLTDYQKACLSMLTNYDMRHQQDLEFLQEHLFDYQDLIGKELALTTISVI